MPRLEAQGVDAAHVAQQAAADVVDVVFLDEVPRRQGGAVAPRPADRDAGVVQVVDVIVRDPVVGALADPDADGMVKDVAAVVDLTVLDNIAGRSLRPLGADLRLAELHTPGGQIVQVAPRDDVASATAA